MPVGVERHDRALTVVHSRLAARNASGKAGALEIIMTGRKVEAQECLHNGLRKKSCPSARHGGLPRRWPEKLPDFRKFACAPTAAPSICAPLWTASGPTAKESSKRKAPPAPRDLPRVPAAMVTIVISGDRTTD